MLTVPITKSGDLPLALAIREGKLDIIKYLVIECNVSVNAAPVTKSGDPPLVLAIREGHHDIVKYLVIECNVSVNDKHLLLAVEHDHPRIVDYLLTDHHLNPNAKDEHQQIPLSLAKSIEVIQVLLKNGADADNAYSLHRKTLKKVFSKDPLKSPVKMFVIGDGGEGKSTLIEAMEHEPTIWAPLVNIFVRPKEVDGVCQRTAGIIPRVFKSRFYGDVQFYDFAGQEAYYSSHAAVIKSVVDTCPPIFILVVGVHKNDSDIKQSISYWLGIITNQCASMEGKAPLIVVGSHADFVEAKNEIERKEEIITQTVKQYISFDLITVLSMDCRYSNSDGMKLLRRMVENASNSLRSNLSVSLNSHMFLIYLTENHSSKFAVTLHEIQVAVEMARNWKPFKNQKNTLSFIPTTIARLVDICIQLSDKGHILFFSNQTSPEQSFIIIDKLALLAEINGTMFAPEDFTQHCQLATSTGVVPRSKLAKQFLKFNITMLVKFLSHLELAVPIEDLEVLRLINSHVSASREPAEFSQSEKYLFCPALIRLEIPPKSFKYEKTYSYHFGWVLSSTQDYLFFDARFLHVLLLRLALSLGFAPEVDPTVPALQHQCSVWKTGVYWNTPQGAEVQVEVFNKQKVIVLIQANTALSGFLKLRSTLLCKVREAASELCPAVTTKEYLVSPCDMPYPLSLSPSVPQFSLKAVAESIVHQYPSVVSNDGANRLQVDDNEVYAHFDKIILQKLFSSSQNEIVSNQFLSNLSVCLSRCSGEIVSAVTSAIRQPLVAASCSQPNVLSSLKSWKGSCDGTYRYLREALDPLGIFAGKNLLELAGIQPEEYSDDTLSATSHTQLNPCTPETLSIEHLQTETGVDDSQLNTVIKGEDINKLSGLFDEVEAYVDKLGLLPAQQTDIKDVAFRQGTQLAMMKALKLWCQPNPFAATFRALIEILLDLKRGDVAAEICEYISKEIPKRK